jgi:hypothetical protein
MAAVRLSCLARNGRSPGEESLTDAIAAQAIEARRPLARSANERPWVDVEQHPRGKTWLIQKVLHKRARTPGEEKEAIAQEKDGIPSEAHQSNGNARSHRVFVGRAEIGAAWSKGSNEGRPYLSLKLGDPSFTAPSSPICPMTRMAKTITLAGRATASRRLNAPCLPQGSAQPTAG